MEINGALPSCTKGQYCLSPVHIPISCECTKKKNTYVSFKRKHYLKLLKELHETWGIVNLG